MSELCKSWRRRVRVVRTGRNLALFFGLTALLWQGCYEDMSRLELEDPGFWGASSGGSDPVDDHPTEGGSACSLWDLESCPEGFACVPSSRGIRSCVEGAVLTLGERCDGRSSICMPGSLCMETEGSAHCTAFCVPGTSSCGSGRCVLWLTVDQETVGRCVR